MAALTEKIKSKEGDQPVMLDDLANQKDGSFLVFAQPHKGQWNQLGSFNNETDARRLFEEKKGEVQTYKNVLLTEVIESFNLHKFWEKEGQVTEVKDEDRPKTKKKNKSK